MVKPDSPYVNGMWPHYWSTYCMHELHDDCRLRCKHCDAHCQCPCHETSAAEALPDPEAN